MGEQLNLMRSQASMLLPLLQLLDASTNSNLGQMIATMVCPVYHP